MAKIQKIKLKLSIKKENQIVKSDSLLQVLKFILL